MFIIISYQQTLSIVSLTHVQLLDSVFMDKSVLIIQTEHVFVYTQYGYNIVSYNEIQET